MLFVVAFLLADSFQTNFQAGLIALKENNLSSAELRLEAAAKLEPGNARVWLALAQTYWKLHKPEPASAAAASVERLTKNPELLHALSFYYSECGDLDRAEHVMQTVLSLDRFQESYYFDLADLFLKQRKFPAALETLNAGRKVFDKSAQLDLATGVAYYGLRRFPEATDAFLETIALDPSAQQPYVFLSRMLDQTESKRPRIRDAFAAYQKREPENYLSNYVYAKALALNEPGRAEALLWKSIALNDGYAASHFELGVLLENRRDLAGAARELERSIALDPKDPASHYHLARVFDRLGKTAEANAERALHAKLVVANAP